jgi:hypothetical protein
MIATLAFAAITVALFCWFYLSESPHNEKTVWTAQDEVYEAVVRDMVTPVHGPVTLKQLVFADTVIFERSDDPGVQSCRDSFRKKLELGQNEAPPFNTPVDKIYRLFTGGWYDASPGAAAIEDFLDKSCLGGPLSQTFHTDLPRAFIGVNSVSFDDMKFENGPPSLKQVFPGARGIISFSHVGFDSGMHEAVLSASYVCGGLCGTGWRYVLRKRKGRWEVVTKSIIWMS